VIAPETLAKYPVRIQAEGGGPVGTDIGYSEDEARVVGERLRGLGYVD